MRETPPLELREARERFLALVEDIRPQLHRYCARMTGSLTDGEDVVQDTLAKAYYQLSMRDSIPDLAPWLFRIAHNRAVDWLRRYERRHVVSVEDIANEPTAADDPDPIERREATALALSCFCRLPVRPRGAVILKDILDHSINEVAEILSMTVPATKAALHRGRHALHSFGETGDDEQHMPASSAAAATRYVDLFNAQDWASLRALLAEEVRLDLVGKADLQGQREVGQYFGRYACQDDVRLRLGSFEGASAIFVTQPGWPPYVIQLGWHGDKLNHIRDFRYVPYILNEFVAHRDGA